MLEIVHNSFNKIYKFFNKKKIENQFCNFKFLLKKKKIRWQIPKKPNMYAELI